MAHEVIGWLEHVSLPSLNLHHIKAKMDTGAQSSALHAENIVHLVIDGKPHVSFDVTDEKGMTSKVKAPFLENRSIKSSSSHITVRPAILVNMIIGEQEFETQFTLINRSLMRYPIIIGREALRDKFVIDSAKSYLLGV